MIRHFLSGCLLAFTLASCSFPPPAEEALSGQWAPTSAELGGQVFPVENFGGATLRLTRDTYEFAGDKGSYSLLSSEAPAKMDIHGHEGPNAGRMIPAIFDLAGDELTVCYQLGSGDRPSDFTSPKGSKVLLVRYKRVHSSLPHGEAAGLKSGPDLRVGENSDRALLFRVLIPNMGPSPTRLLGLMHDPSGIGSC